MFKGKGGGWGEGGYVGKRWVSFMDFIVDKIICLRMCAHACVRVCCLVPVAEIFVGPRLLEEMNY